MAIQAVRLELREHADAAQPAVNAVGEGEVDDAVEPAERHRGLGPVAGERLQAGAFAAGEDRSEDIANMESE